MENTWVPGEQSSSTSLSSSSFPSHLSSFHQEEGRFKESNVLWPTIVVRTHILYPNSPLNQQNTDVSVSYSMLCILTPKLSEYHCEVVIVTLWVLLTNNCWVSHHGFVRCFIQQAENWSEYLPGLLLHGCSPSSFDCFWQWQQEEAAWEDFSKDLLPNENGTVWQKSQIKHESSFFPLSLFSIIEWK